MAPRKTNRKPRMSEQQIDTGGGNPLKGWIASGKKVVTRTVNNAAQNVGSWAAPTPRGSVMPKSGTLKGVRGEVYTPSGVYEGKQVFIRKPALTDRQVEGILKAQETRAMREFARHRNTGAKAAKVAGVGGAAFGWAANDQVGNIAKAVKSAVSTANKKARGGGKNKK
jgi:hypothetical protein